ncbi:hypothetical protein DCC85_04145 [Paenibacillus sp. CAA11]|uniref:hypothetical protein n=1 Tax=Paenibacillus sp. CAA11 TaxID=1532905 RepID=UPI000D3591A4|nr:hypothetical protein [Paenibacillus sp. CAA11]AWB43491.1 hypothetical protein DCC85_04145 [Paenibacillus sp. CAA11]
MKKLSAYMMVCLVAFVSVLTGCEMNRHRFSGIDLQHQPLPLAPYTKYLYFAGGLYTISTDPVDPKVFEGRIGMKVGEIKNIGYKLYEVGDVAVADPEGEAALQIGDEIHRVTV